MNIKKEIVKISFYKLLPQLHDLMLELELKEYIFGGEFNGENLREFKVLKSGKVKSRDANRRKLDDWSDFMDIKEIKEELKKEIPYYDDGTQFDIRILKAFMLMLSREVSLLKLMIKDLKKEISSIKKDVDTEIVLKRLLTEKQL